MNSFLKNGKIAALSSCLLFETFSLSLASEEDSYSGILQYLSEKANAGSDSERIRLKDLKKRIQDGENVFNSMKGKHEWAYLSDIDGSAQPFTVFIPHKTTNQPWPLIIELHGGGGTHLRKENESMAGTMRICVLGHGKNARYRGLSEWDVREVLKYALAHWPIDADRIALRGFSLGGTGSFTLASRHPDWFYAIQPQAGWGISAFPENLTNVRLFAYTSRDDYAIHAYCRSTVGSIARLGGRPGHLIAEGYGHSWPKAYFGALESWITQPIESSPIPSDFTYTAEDEAATGAWGVDVAIWGDSPSLARFDFQRKENEVSIKTENVYALRLTPASWGHPQTQRCFVSVDGSALIELSKAEQSYFLVNNIGGWKIIEKDKLYSDVGRAHFPGGLDSLLHGEKLTVIYGTNTSKERTEKQKLLAETLAKLPLAAVQRSPHRMYGGFPVVSDLEWKQSPQQDGNIILVGGVDENLVAAELTQSMPAKIDGETAQIEGDVWPLKNATAGLLGKRNQKSKQLVYWIVSQGLGAYEFSELPFKLLGYDTRPNISPDLMITANRELRLIAARRLTGKWDWCESDKANDNKINPAHCTNNGIAKLKAIAIKEASKANFGYSLASEQEKGFRVYYGATSGTTTIEDIASMHGADRIMVFELRGKDIIKLSQLKDTEAILTETISRDKLDPNKRYSLAGIASDSWALLRMLKDPDLPLTLTNLDVGTAIRNSKATKR